MPKKTHNKKKQRHIIHVALMPMNLNDGVLVNTDCQLDRI